MSGRVSDFLIEQWLSQLQVGCWVSLHHDNPDVAGAYASEIFGGGYTRQAILFGAPNNRAVFNDNGVIWNGLPAVTTTHVGVWDAQMNGNYLVSFAMDVPTRVLAGKSISYAPQQIAISVD
jgi:hypothetical protein